MSYTYGTKGAPAVGGGLPGLPTRGDNDIGTIKAFDVYPGPDWLPCDGAQYSRTDYPLLAQKIGGFRNSILSTLRNPQLGSTPYEAATDCNGTWIVVGSGGKASISRNNGNTWSVLDLSSIFGTNPLYAVETDEQGTWAVGGFSNNIAVSRDNGYTWTSFNVGIQVSSIKTDKKGTWVFAANAASTTTRRSTDNIVSVSPVSGIGSVQISIRGLATDGNGTWVACRLAAQNVYRSTDNGANWTSVTNWSSQPLWGIDTDGKGNWISGISGTDGRLVYSNNNGADFYAINVGFQNVAEGVRDVAFGGPFGWMVARYTSDIRRVPNDADITSGNFYSSVPALFGPNQFFINVVGTDKKGTWLAFHESTYVVSNTIDPTKFETPSYGWPSTNQYIKAR